MKKSLTRRSLLAAPAFMAMASGTTTTAAIFDSSDRFLITNPTIDGLTSLHQDGSDTMTVAASPWEIALGKNARAYISTARSLVVVDPYRFTILAEIPWQTSIADIGYGEYRSGGMGIAITPDGKTVAAGIHIEGANGMVELFDIESDSFFATIPVGVRPFDVVSAPDGRYIYSIDHDSFSITVIELASLTSWIVDAAPLGYGDFDKPHYAAVRSDGTLLLPYSGRLLWMIDPISGESSSMPLSANTHQHGITLSDDEMTAYIVGTGSGGAAGGSPSLTVLDLSTRSERIIELELPHEQVELTSDGKTAMLTGGYTFANGGWDGLTQIDLETDDMFIHDLAGQPLAIVRLPGI